MSNEQIVQYVEIIWHNCSYHLPETKVHMIKNCKERQKFIDAFIKAYEEGKWIPQDK